MRGGLALQLWRLKTGSLQAQIVRVLAVWRLKTDIFQAAMVVDVPS